MCEHHWNIISIGTVERYFQGPRRSGGALDIPPDYPIITTTWIDRCVICGATETHEIAGNHKDTLSEARLQDKLELAEIKISMASDDQKGA